MRRDCIAQVVLTVCGSVALLVGCASASPSANERSTAASAGPSAVTCDPEPIGPVSAEQAASCVYRGWLEDNQTLLERFGVSGVTDHLPVAMGNPTSNYHGCESGVPADEVICSWSAQGEGGPVIFRMHVAGNDPGGYRVIRIEMVE